MSDREFFYGTIVTYVLTLVILLGFAWLVR